MCKSKTDIFIEKAIKLHGNIYDYSEVNYTHSLTKIIIKCKKHGIFFQKPTYHLNGFGCQKCSTETANLKKTSTKEEFIEKAKKIHGEKYDYSQTNYIKSKKKIEIICPIHGMFNIFPFNHLLGNGCNRCACASFTFTKEQFIEKANYIHNYKYDYSIVEYKNMKTKVDIICHEHGIFNQTPDAHTRNNKACGCPKCGQIKSKLASTKNVEIFLNRANEKHNNFYDYSQIEYYSLNVKITILCPVHGPFFQSPKSHQKGAGCPKCNNSHGETKIAYILTKNNISFKEQFKFDDCRNIYPLPFDFYLPDFNTIIEFDGIQHYKEVKRFDGEAGFIKTQKHDKIKNDYCENNNINLIRIKYDSKNIEEYILEKLTK